VLANSIAVVPAHSYQHHEDPQTPNQRKRRQGMVLPSRHPEDLWHAFNLLATGDGAVHDGPQAVAIRRPDVVEQKRE
jgi:hypothetical protein